MENLVSPVDVIYFLSFAGFFMRRSILFISYESHPLLLAARSRFDGYLLFMFRLLCLTVILLVSDFEYLKILRCIYLFVDWKDYYLAEGLLSSHRGLVADDF